MLETKLILLRGPSGSGKSTIAKLLRDHLKDTAALIGQDHFRRIVLKEKDKPSSLNAQLIFQTVQFAFNHDYHVILEGIFPAKHYTEMFEQIWQIHPNQNYVYYFDISFEETLRRHATKPEVNEWGEDEMKRWWLEKDFLGIKDENVLDERFTAQETIVKILHDTQLG